MKAKEKLLMVWRQIIVMTVDELVLLEQEVVKELEEYGKKVVYDKVRVMMEVGEGL